MKEKDLQKFIDAMPYLKDVMQDDMTIIVFDFKTTTIMAVDVGETLKYKLKPGDKFQAVSNAFDEIIKRKIQLRSIVPKSYYGVSARGCLTPVENDKGEVVAIVSVSKNIETETAIDELTGLLFNSMEQLNAGVEEIASNSQQLATFIKEIWDFTSQTQEKIKEIDEITQTIKSISSQSNLLSLNAAIEAARVGDAGRGFSVVANEMSKLAKMSKESAENADKSLRVMGTAVETIGRQINESSMISDSQAAATEEIAATTDSIVGVVRQLADMSRIVSIEEGLQGGKKTK